MSQSERFSHSELSKLGIIFAQSPDVKLVNEYRNLRTNLIASQRKKNFTMLVTCVVPNYNVTHIVANIAAAFSLDSNKTSLVINADISEDSLDQLLSIETDLGIIDYLESENLNVEDILYETPINRLRYVPCGKVREETSEYFTSTKMKNFVDVLLNRYPERFPIIQAPSIGSAADTRILIDSCDCVILVCPYGLCDENVIHEAMLTVGSDKFAGIVLAGFD
jgi:Mrp family chromosome partitioning ATPase